MHVLARLIACLTSPIQPTSQTKPVAAKRIQPNASLETLEGVKWDEPAKDSAPHILECHRLRKIAVRDLTVEGLHMLIGQEIGLHYLVPIALEKLEENPWAAGMHFDGDLLLNVLRIAPNYWSDNTAQLERLNGVMGALDEYVKFFVRDLQSAWQKLFSNG